MTVGPYEVEITLQGKFFLAALILFVVMATFALRLWVADRWATRDLNRLPPAKRGTVRGPRSMPITPHTSDASVEVKVSTHPTKIDSYPVLCAIEITNVDAKGRDFKDEVLVQIDDISLSAKPDGIPWPFVLRTDAQIRDNRKARWNLSHRQTKVVPVMFQGPLRKNEWWLIDERRERYFLSPQDMQLLIGVYGAGRAVKVLVTIERGKNWSARSRLEVVSDDHRLARAQKTKEPGHVLSVPNRIALTKVAELAAAAGWNDDDTDTPGGGLGTFASGLRQAGCDGLIQFYGRKYEDDIGKDLDAGPLVKISKEHFEEFEFSEVELFGEPDNYNIFTSKLGHFPNEYMPRNYRDIHANEEQATAWLAHMLAK